MKNTLIGIITILIVITAVVANNVTGKMLKDQAIDGCYQTGRLEFQNAQNQKATVPDNYWFNECMKKKGYQK
jgi:hypothetical protein